MKYEIYLYIIYNCEGCEIMHRNINEVINKLKCNIKMHVIDHNQTVEAMKLKQIEDFPTMIFSIDGKESFRLKGTYTAEDIQEWISKAIE